MSSCVNGAAVVFTAGFCAFDRALVSVAAAVVRLTEGNKTQNLPVRRRMGK